MNKLVNLRNIKRALRIEQPNESIKYKINGRVSRIRSYKSKFFLDLIDGSNNGHLQVIVGKSIIEKPQLGAYLSCQGNLVPSPGRQQAIEFQVDKIEYHGPCDPESYPLANSDVSQLPKGWFRRHIHLRPRSPHFSSLLRVRSELELGLHMIMKQMDFVKVHTPGITSNDSEASSDLFTVQRTKIRDAHEPRTVSDGFFHKDVFMITSAQLHLECLAAALSRVYCLSTAFRAESSMSRHHLSEFSMFEAEESNVNELDSLLDRVESIIKFVAQYLSEVSEHKEDFAGLVNSNQHMSIYERLSQKQYVRMSYQEALGTLTNKIRQPFDGPTNYGTDLGKKHERALLEYCDNVPIFLTNFPKQLKPFYMAANTNGEALCFDLIAPFGGEICGGSLREDNLDRLKENIKQHLQRIGKSSINGSDDGSMMERFDWYLDLRRYGTFPHGGFGIGFERLCQALLGINDIKDTIAFPRTIGNCPM